MAACSLRHARRLATNRRHRHQAQTVDQIIAALLKVEIAEKQARRSATRWGC
jgi:hypothetical protein